MLNSVDPLNNTIIDFLMSKSNETAEYDFKYLVNLRKSGDFVKIAEDIFAMSNYGGGFLLFGFKEREGHAGYDPLGLPDSYSIDGAAIQRKFNSYSNEPITLYYKEYTRSIRTDDSEELRRFAILYVPPGQVELYPIKEGNYRDQQGRKKTVFRDKDILIRRGSVTDRATPSERSWITKRLLDEEFQIGLLSGDPDTVNEHIYSNIFELRRLPNFVYECCLNQRENLRKFRWSARVENIAFVNRGDFIYSFENLNVDSLNEFFYTTTHNKISTKEFLEDNDNEILFKWLLNSEISLYLLNEGFRYDSKYGNTYFFPKTPDSNERKVSWQSRYRKSTRFVVRYYYEQNLNSYLYRHDAAELRFTNIGESYYLTIKPRIILSYNGMNAVHDSKQGPIITRLLHDEYNDKYLNNVLFWISQFKGDDESITLNDRLNISRIPKILEFNKGIRYDRPKTEFNDRIEEMYMLGE
ncbi:MAG: hypothetical protein NWE89_05265 [Candidatus Bathyarchaeota archaeon]|nr:hypothetical protein [Candidatus Bathyarchaeota archaeon]